MNEGCPHSPFYTGTFLTPSSSSGPTPVCALMRVLWNQARLTYWVGLSEVFQRRPRSEGPVGVSVSLCSGSAASIVSAAHSPPSYDQLHVWRTLMGGRRWPRPLWPASPSADSAPTQTVGRLSRTPVRMHREVLYPHAARPGPLEVFPCDGGSSRAHRHHWLRRVGVHCW